MRQTNPAYVRKHPLSRDDYVRMAVIFAVRGNNLPHAKLTAEKVREIRANREGLTDKQQAERHGVHRNTIYKIRHRIVWWHV